MELNQTLFCFRRKVISQAELDNYALMTLEPSFKGSVFHFSSTVSYINTLNRHNFKLKYLKEAFLTNQIVFYFTKNFYLLDEVNDKISQFKANGVINFWISKYIDEVSSANRNVSLSPLNMQQLIGIFELLLCGWLLALVAFIVEKFERISCLGV